jgi:hypothetical protein
MTPKVLWEVSARAPRVQELRSSPRTIFGALARNATWDASRSSGTLSMTEWESSRKGPNRRNSGADRTPLATRCSLSWRLFSPDNTSGPLRGRRKRPDRVQSSHAVMLYTLCRELGSSIHSETTPTAWSEAFDSGRTKQRGTSSNLCWIQQDRESGTLRLEKSTGELSSGTTNCQHLRWQRRLGPRFDPASHRGANDAFVKVRGKRESESSWNSVLVRRDRPRNRGSGSAAMERGDTHRCDAPGNT